VKGNHLPREEEEARLNCYNRGLLDKQAAQERNIGCTTFHDWRERRGLPAHGGTGWGGRRVNTKYWRLVNV
jgi:RimJ/RimL family protein N-acetyltransferase